MNQGLELIGGAEYRKIIVVTYDQNWPKKYQLHEKNIKSVLGSSAVRIDHIGSTSVADMAAKPIIDIQLSVNDPENELQYMPMLEAGGYVLRLREKGHRMVRTKELDVHIHVCRRGSDWERRHLLFRDWLRVNSSDHKIYKNMKQMLAQQDWETMNHYADAKSEVINQITARAEKWAEESGWHL